MRKIVFINPPNHLSDAYYLAPPLGLLCLARVATRAGWQPEILDFDLPKYRELAETPAAFYSTASDAITRRLPNVAAFTSMGVNAHVSMLLAERIKSASPRIMTIAGGPYFGSIKEAMRSICPSIDRTIGGEAESELFNFLRSMSGSSEVQKVPATLDHPFDSYNAVDLNDYFEANPRRLLNYETGRGCIFKCSFCYSPPHYQGVRSVSSDTIKEDFRLFAEKGARSVFMVNDNFINSPAEAAAICQALSAARTGISWNCYATLPQLSPALAQAMFEAGCRSVYLGIDAAGAGQQSTFKKRFFRNLEQLSQKISAICDTGIRPTCAFIFDLFNPNEDEIAAAIIAALHCARLGAAIRFNALSLYPGTPIGERVRRETFYSEARCEIMLDCPRAVRQNPLAEKFPRFFPFHSHESENEFSWREGLNMLWSAQRLIQKFPEYFLNLGIQESKDWVAVFRDIGTRRQEFEHTIFN